jgi:hypothetical protein
MPVNIPGVNSGHLLHRDFATVAMLDRNYPPTAAAFAARWQRRSLRRPPPIVVRLRPRKSPLIAPPAPTAPPPPVELATIINSAAIAAATATDRCNTLDLDRYVRRHRRHHILTALEALGNRGTATSWHSRRARRSFGRPLHFATQSDSESRHSCRLSYTPPDRPPAPSTAPSASPRIRPPPSRPPGSPHTAPGIAAPSPSPIAATIPPDSAHRCLALATTAARCRMIWNPPPPAIPFGTILLDEIALHTHGR